MLSLRDTGKIQQDSASILNLGALCGFIPPFSLKDFILKDCLVDVKTIRIGVALLTWNPANPNLLQAPKPTHPDKSWYEDFLLNWKNEKGVANFWYKQSFGKLKIEGQVLPWTPLQLTEAALFVFKGPNGNTLPKPLLLRGVAQNIVKQQFQENFDAFIGVFNLPTDHALDGGTTGDNLHSSFNIGDPFDFHAHEVGHLIGGVFHFHHSYGLETYMDDNDINWNGSYGYSYCIMSALTYGKRNTEFTQPKPFPSAPDLAKEETSRGPGLNGGTRALLGWANTIEFSLDNETEAEFDLQSLGFNHPNPQVLLIRKGERKYFIEYRSSLDENDQGISNLGFNAVLVVGIVTGGIATVAPGNFPASGTFLQEIAINFNTELPDRIINITPFWGVRIVSLNSKRDTIHIKIFKHFQFSLRVWRRTHNFLLSDDTKSFDIERAPSVPFAGNEYMNFKKWSINGQPLKNLRSLVNL